MLAGQTHVLQQGLCSKLIVSLVLPHGKYNSHEPTGWSSRARYAYGFTLGGSSDTIPAARGRFGVGAVVANCACPVRSGTEIQGRTESFNRQRDDLRKGEWTDDIRMQPSIVTRNGNCVLRSNLFMGRGDVWHLSKVWRSLWRAKYWKRKF